jgi:xylose isomerase
MNAVMTLGYLCSMDKLGFLHFGSQIKAQFDNDFPPLVGPEGLKETVQMFWMLKQVGWKGVVEYDCHMLRAEGDWENADESRKQFIRNCTDALSISLEIASRLDGLKIAGLSQTQVDLAATMAMCKVDKRKIAAMSTKQ